MRFRAWLLPVGVFVLTTLAQWPFFDLWFSFMDEGHMLQFADIVHQGGEFYRDATFYPLPGAFYLLSFVFDVFGPSVLASRWVVMLEFSVFVALLFLLLRRATGSSRWALLGVCCLWLYRIWSFPHWQMYSYSTTSLLVFVLSLCALLSYFEGLNRRMLALSGLLYGLGVLCKQDYGAAVGLAIALSLIVFFVTETRDRLPSRAQMVAIFLLPAATVGGLTGFYYWQVGLLEDLLRFTVFNHFVGIGAYEYTRFPDFFPILGQDPANRTMFAVVNHLPSIMFTTDWQTIRANYFYTDTPLYDFLIKLFFYGPQFLLVGSVWKLWLGRDRFRDQGDPLIRQRALTEFVVLAVGCTLILLVWLNKPQDYVHLAVLYWPLILLVVIHAHDLLSGRSHRQWAAGLLLFLPALILIAYSGRLVYHFKASYTAPVEGERAGIFVRPDEAKMLNDVVRYIHQHSEPDEVVAALPYFPMAHFLANRMGPHRSAYIVWPFPEIPDRDQAIVDAMEATNTDVVIYNFTQFYSFDPVWEHAPVLFEYLVENFEMDHVFNSVSWVQPAAALAREQRDSNLSKLRVLPPDAEGLSIRVEEPGGPARPVPPEARSVYVKEMLWPFRPVIALRPSAHERKTVLAIPVRVPTTGARLESAVAVHPKWWSRLPATWVDFSLRIRVGDEVSTLYEKRLKPASVFEDRAWFEVDVDLDPWSGRDVVLELINETGASQGETLWMGGWSVPHLVSDLPLDPGRSELPVRADLGLDKD